MYYYKNEEIGTLEEAKKYVLADKNRVWSLLGSFLEAFEEDELQEYFLGMVIEGFPIDTESLVGDALEHLENMWLDNGGWSQLQGDRAMLGDFEYENWEEEE